MVLSIIIVSYNTKDLLLACLEAIYKTVYSVTFEVIVVDNASSDGTSEEILNQKFPATLLVREGRSISNFKFIKNNKNLGFSKGCNSGASIAKGDYLLFLNSDAFLQNDMVKNVISHFEDKKIGVIGGRLKNSNGSIQRSYASFYNIFSLFMLLFAKNVLDIIKNYSSKIKEVDWVSGGFIFVRKDIFQQLNGFDENLFMYVEDMEFCYRVKKAGYKILFYPGINAIHKEHGSSNRSFAIINIYKGILYFYKKHKSRAEYIFVKGLLYSKAYSAIIFGYFIKDKYLVSTYKTAIKF